tara:strand:+ start:1075 stop:1635 length:561 start_codon:yes stop_codon:yes gene_type:complete
VAFVSYIKPKFDELRDLENDIVSYKAAVADATQFTSLLAELTNRADSVSAGELQALEKFLPSETDVVEVEQDIEAMAILSGLLPISIAVSDAEESQREVFDDEEGEIPSDMLLERSLEAKRFNMTLVGEYDDLKSFLENLEVNAYPLKIVSLEAVSGELEQGGVVVNSGLIYNLVLEAKSFNPIQN